VENVIHFQVKEETGVDGISKTKYWLFYAEHCCCSCCYWIL